jgi:hypothetical protein
MLQANWFSSTLRQFMSDRSLRMIKILPLLLALAGANCANFVRAQESAPAKNTPTKPEAPSDATTPSAKNVLATILQSGSTNTRGYRVVIRTDGSATVELGSTRGILRVNPGPSAPAKSQEFPPGFVDAKALHHLLEEIGDVSKIQTGGCAKSVSFGTRTQIVYADKTSGDLQCARLSTSSSAPSFEQAEDLAKMVREILQKLKVNDRRVAGD